MASYKYLLCSFFAIHKRRITTILSVCVCCIISSLYEIMDTAYIHIENPMSKGLTK